MSLPRKDRQPPFGTLLCSALSVILSLVLSALAATLGHTYESRVTLYLTTLLWAVAGNLILLWLTRGRDSVFSSSTFVKWFIGSWLWPFMLIASFMKRPKK